MKRGEWDLPLVIASCVEVPDSSGLGRRCPSHSDPVKIAERNRRRRNLYVLKKAAAQEGESYSYLREVAEGLEQDGFSEEQVYREKHTSLLVARARQQQLIDRVIAGDGGEGSRKLVALKPAGADRDVYVRDADGCIQEVYYASYGSNLFADRFLVYIQGGSPEGSERVYPGCRDNTLPGDDVGVALNGTVHYVGESRVWTGGVGFLDASSYGRSLGRAYRVSSQQLNDVVAQESNRPVGDTTVDVDHVVETGRVVSPGAYGTLVHVGDYNGCPVVTFTGPFTTAEAKRGGLAVGKDGLLREEREAGLMEGPYPFVPVHSNKPSEGYKAMISRGLAETHGLSQEEADIYFAGASGVL